jgi:hypothetical protein
MTNHVEAALGPSADEYISAIATLDADIEHAADQIHHDLVVSGLPEDEQSRLMQEAYGRLAALRAHSVAKLDQAFLRTSAVH